MDILGVVSTCLAIYLEVRAYYFVTSGVGGNKGWVYYHGGTL